MSFDLEILVVKQKEVYNLDFQSKIIIRNEKEHGPLRYMDIWKFASNSEGIWYSLGQDGEIGFCAYYICSGDFDKDVQEINIPYWINDDDVKDNLTPLIIKHEVRVDFERILKGLMESSPVKTIMVISRYQSEHKEIICGTLSLIEYLSLLDEGKILFNVCYIISN
jgi:hypothetical protein